MTVLEVERNDEARTGRSCDGNSNRNFTRLKQVAALGGVVAMNQRDVAGDSLHNETLSVSRDDCTRTSKYMRISCA